MVFVIETIRICIVVLFFAAGQACMKTSLLMQWGMSINKCRRVSNSQLKGLHHYIFYLRMAYFGSVGTLNQFSVHFMFTAVYLFIDTLYAAGFHKQPACQQPLLIQTPAERILGFTQVQVMCCVRCAGHQRFFTYFGGLVSPV